MNYQDTNDDFDWDLWYETVAEYDRLIDEGLYAEAEDYRLFTNRNAWQKIRRRPTPVLEPVAVDAS